VLELGLRAAQDSHTSIRVYVRREGKHVAHAHASAIAYELVSVSNCRRVCVSVGAGAGVGVGVSEHLVCLHKVLKG
jgi:hypothetical protein